MKSSREIRTSKWLCHCTSLHFFLKTESCLSSKTTKYTRRTLTTNVFRWVTARFNYILSSSIADKCHSSFLSTVGYLNPFVHLYIKKKHIQNECADGTHCRTSIHSCPIFLRIVFFSKKNNNEKIAGHFQRKTLRTHPGDNQKMKDR